MTQHNHIWTLPDEHGTWTCTDCGDTSPTCVVQRPTDHDNIGHPTGIPAQHICDPCHRHEMRVLDDITTALTHWQPQPKSPVPAIRYDRDRTTGTPTPSDGPTDGINTPRDIYTQLQNWADTWAGLRNEPPAVGDITTFLKRHILWAANNAHHSGFHNYRQTVRQLRHAARRIAGLLPKRLHGPCIHCGGRVVQDWADHTWKPRRDGLSDTLRCTRCHLTWPDHETWMFTNRHTLQALPTVRPDALVTLEDARRIFPDVPAGTWRWWVHQDRQRIENGEEARLPEQGKTVRGDALYVLADLNELVEQRRSTNRPGRPASGRITP